MTLTMSNGHKKDFLQWKTEQEKKGRKFYTRLSEVMQTDRDLQVGDKVMFTNDYGIVFGPHEIMAFGEPEYNRCVFIDNDSYWFADRPDQLTLVDKYLAGRYINILKDYALIKDLKVVDKESYLKIHPHISEGDYEIIKAILEGKNENLTILPVRFIDEKRGFCEEVFKGILNNRYYVRQERQDRNTVLWTTASTEWEADCPLRKDIHIFVFKDNAFQYEEVVFGSDYAVPYVAESGVAKKACKFSWE